MKQFDRILRVIYKLILAGVIAPILLLFILDIEVFGFHVGDDIASGAGTALLILLFTVGAYLEYRQFRARQGRDELR